MKIKKFTIALVLALSSSPVFASDWQFTTETDNSSHYMDFDSVASVGKHRKAWVRIDYSAAKETEGYPKKQYQSAKALYYFDCSAKTLGAIHFVYYKAEGASGEVVDSSVQKFDPKFLSDVVPDTVGETLLRVACSAPAARAKLKAQNAAVLAALRKEIADARKKKTAEMEN